MKLRLHFAKCRGGIRENVHPAKAQMPGMPDDIEEANSASPALRRVHPIPSPGIVRHIALAASPNVKAIKRVIKNRQPNTKQLQADHEGKATEEFNLLCVCSRTFGSEGIRYKMLNQKQSDRHYSCQGMQTAQQERMSLARAERSHAAFDLDRSCTAGSGCHGFLATSEMKRELFIMLAGEKGSQIRGYSGYSLMWFSSRPLRPFFALSAVKVF